MEPWWIFNYTSLITLLSAVTDMQSAYSEFLSRKNSLPRSGDRSLSDSFQFVVTSLVAQTVKASSYNAGDLGSIPGLGRPPGEGNGNPLQYSCLESPMDRGAWQATVHGVAKSQTVLSNFTSLHFCVGLRFQDKVSLLGWPLAND